MASKRQTARNGMNRTSLLAALNRYSRSDALKELTSDRYMGGTTSHFKLWVTPDTIGREILDHLNSQSEKKVRRQSKLVTPATLRRRLTKEFDTNKERVRVLTKEMRAKGLLFFRVDVGLESGDYVKMYKGSPKGRDEITYLRESDVISNRRHVKYYTAHYGSMNSYIAVPIENIKGVQGLMAKAKEFDRGACIENSMRRLDGLDKLGEDAMNAQINEVFTRAVEGLSGVVAAQDLRQDFEEAVTKKFKLDNDKVRSALSSSNKPRL